ncbi:hypothetical protein EI94DRAFT_1706950 [Lactarius quietus]|nr:hypothetical protein EI94DRAFT_1706950 [Lactarius quietus]
MFWKMLGRRRLLGDRRVNAAQDNTLFVKTMACLFVQDFDTAAGGGVGESVWALGTLLSQLTMYPTPRLVTSLDMIVDIQAGKAELKSLMCWFSHNFPNISQVRSALKYE